MREISRQNCLFCFFISGFFQQPTARASEPIFTKNDGPADLSPDACAFLGERTK